MGTKRCYVPKVSKFFVEKADEKNGATCPVIIFPPRVMVIKMLKIAHFFVFFAYDSKKLVTVWAKCLSAPERSYWVISENGMVNRLWSYHLWDVEGSIQKAPESAKTTETLYFLEMTCC